MGNFCCHCGQAICDCVRIEYDRLTAHLLTRAEDAELLAERRKWGAEEMDRVRAECADLKARVAELEDLLRDVRHHSGIELDDERLSYLPVQIDRVVWDAIAALVAAKEG
jgi:hypothetical protein